MIGIDRQGEVVGDSHLDRRGISATANPANSHNPRTVCATLALIQHTHQN